ncbi:unnamed protein product [Ilex paraguariensis]|uniref:ubiquitinyl hydrolase 1 n=1 Tax=Ilex paraguariensis TaxID=185542 RepID=A0ABC8TUV4_9AQUA
MTRILVQRGSGSSSSQNRSSSLVPSSSSLAPPQSQVTSTSQVASAVKDGELGEEVPEKVAVEELSEYYGASDSKGVKSDELLQQSSNNDCNDGDSEEILDDEKGGIGVVIDDDMGSRELVRGLSRMRTAEEGNEGSGGSSLQMAIGGSYLPLPPVPPPKRSSVNSNLRRFGSGGSSAVCIGSSRRAAVWPIVSTRTSQSGSRPSSPRSHCENEGYNSADEKSPCFGSSYHDAERERQFEIDIRRVKGLEVKRMLDDGNCLFRAVADQVYGDSEVYDLVRQMCIDYMGRENWKTKVAN